MSKPTNTDEFDEMLDTYYAMRRLVEIAEKTNGAFAESGYELVKDAPKQTIITKLRERDERVAREARIESLQDMREKVLDVYEHIVIEDRNTSLMTVIAMVDNKIRDQLATLKPNSEASDD